MRRIIITLPKGTKLAQLDPDQYTVEENKPQRQNFLKKIARTTVKKFIRETNRTLTKELYKELANTIHKTKPGKNFITLYLQKGKSLKAAIKVIFYLGLEGREAKLCEDLKKDKTGRKLKEIEATMKHLKYLTRLQREALATRYSRNSLRKLEIQKLLEGEI